MRELDTDLLKIIGYFGVDNQQTKLLEEVTELERTLNRIKEGYYTKENQ